MRVRPARLLGSAEAAQDGSLIPQGSLPNALAGIAPRDVARIDVLKDAAATGFYGARGANGVSVITTKRSR